MTNHLELEKTLWQAADKLRNNMDAAEYKHIVLGLIFLKFISDAFDELYQQLDATKHETGADPEDKDEYTADVYLRYYVYFLALSMRETFISTASGGTATLNMNTSQFSNLSVIYPTDNVLEKFNEIVSPLMEKILENQHQIRTLTQLRDNLLPKLMSGQIEIER